MPFFFFKNGSNYFDPPTSFFMINFRVKDIKALMEKLKEEDVEIIGEVLEEIRKIRMDNGY